MAKTHRKSESSTSDWHSLFTWQLDKIAESYQNELDKILETVRRVVIIPLCRRRKWTFLAGNGTWMFCKGEQIISVESVPEKVVEILQLEFLNGGRFPIGTCIPNVIEEDLSNGESSK